jgi:hypothetical protein
MQIWNYHLKIYRMKIPFKSTDNTKPQWKTFIMWLAIFTALFLATMLLEGCAAAKPTQFKNHCNVIMVG